MMRPKKLFFIITIICTIFAFDVFSQNKITITVYGDEGQNLQPVEWLKTDAAARELLLRSWVCRLRPYMKN